jgi:uncharacterized membrane protein
MPDGNRIDPLHQVDRDALKAVGPPFLGLGGILIISGFAEFLWPLEGSERRVVYWCVFLGLSFLYLGGVMMLCGYVDRVARYMSR